MCIVRAFIALLVLATIGTVAGAAEHHPADRPARPLAEILGDLAGPDSLSDDAAYELDDAVRVGRIPADPAEADQLLAFAQRELARQLDGEIPPIALGSSGVFYFRRSVVAAAGLIVMFPAESSREIAHRLVVAPDVSLGARMGGPSSTRAAGLKVLATLHDPRALDPLLARTRTGDPSARQMACRMLADLGDPAAIAPLLALAADTSIVDSVMAYRQTSGGKPNREFFVGEARRLQDAARRAARDLELYQQGLVVPFELSDRDLDRLRSEGLAVTAEVANEPFEHIKPEYPFVTADAVWRCFTVLVRATWDDLEHLVLAPQTAALCRDLAAACLAQADDLDDPALADLARRNAARLLVAVRLLDPDAPVDLPPNLAALVADETGRVTAAAGVQFSTLLDLNEDYAAYLPRGCHSDEPAMAAWFRAATWLGRGTWRFGREDELRQALLLAAVIDGDSALRASWSELDALQARWFGAPDDCTPDDVIAAGGIAPADALADAEAFAAKRAALLALPLPRINSILDAATHAEAQGLRLLGHRSSPDAVLFQAIMDPPGRGIWPPSGLDVAAGLLRSSLARDLRRNALPGDRRAAWDADMAVAANFAALVPPTAPLPGSGLHCLAALLVTDPRAPSFTRTEAWQAKQLNSVLGGWVEVRHAAFLYLKQAGMLKGGSAMGDRFHGYVEPYPDFFARLGAVVAAMSAQLEGSGYFDAVDAAMPGPPIASDRDVSIPPPATNDEEGKRRSQADRENKLDRLRADRARWLDLAHLLAQLEDLARRELAGEPQTAADFTLLRGVARRLQHLQLNVTNGLTASEPMSLVVDVAVNQTTTHEVLETALGRPLAVYVAVPDDQGRRYVCRGAVYTYHEFTRPADRRLDDTGWRELDRFPAPGAPVPWLLQQPALSLEYTLSREELAALPDRLAGRRTQGHHMPPHARILTRWRESAGAFAGARVDPADRDLLVELAHDPETSQVALAFVLDQMVALSGETITVADWRGLLDAAEPLAETESSSDDALASKYVYWSILGLRRCGEDGEAELARARAMVDRFDEYVRRGLLEVLPES